VLTVLIIVWYVNDLFKLFILRTSGMHSIIKAQFVSSEGYTRNNGVLQQMKNISAMCPTEQVHY